MSQRQTMALCRQAETRTPGATRGWEKKEEFSPRALKGNMALLRTLTLDSGPWNCDHLFLWSPSLSSFVMAALGRQYREGQI